MKFDRQEIFNRVKNHLLTQGVKSTDKSGDGTCLYRGPNGTKCAIGVLLKDEHWDASKNSASIWDVGHLLEKSLETTLTMENNEFLADLQEIHDSRMVEDWADALADYADMNGLDY